MSSKHKKRDSSNFLMQGAIMAVAAVIAKIIGVVYRIPLANILGDEGVGFYGYAFEIYAVALMLSSFSLPLAVSKLVAARMALGEKRNALRVFFAATIFAIIVGLTVSLVVFFGAGIFLSSAEMTYSIYALKVLSPCLFIVTLMGVLRGYFQGLGTMVPTAISQVVEQLVNAISAILGASIMLKAGLKAAEKQADTLLAPAYGAAGATLGPFIGALVAFLFLLFVLYAMRKQIRRQIRTDKTRHQESYSKIMKVLLLTLAPVILSTAIYNINQILDQTLFSKFMAAQGYAQNEYAAMLGIYTAKYNTLINVPLAMANALAASVIPSLTVAVNSGDRRLTKRKIQQTIRFTMIFAIPCFVGFAVLAKPIMVLLYNDSRTTPTLLLSLGAITVVFYCLSTVTNAILQGLNKMKTPVINAGISLVIHLVSIVIMLGVLKWNIYSIVASNIVFSLCMCILNARAVTKACGYRQEIVKTYAKPIIAAGVMGAVTFVFYLAMDKLIGGRYIPAVLSVLVAIVIYAVSILKLGALTEGEMYGLPKGELLVRICRKLHLLRN